MSDETTERLAQEIIDLTNALIREVVRHTHCRECGQPAIEIFNTDAPFIGYTGIYRCINDGCITDLFDPTFRETTQ